MHSVQLFGASVRGPAHIVNSLPNQDALLLKRLGRHGTLAVVCDGMGSKPYADIGAQKACKAVHMAIKNLGLTGFNPKLLIPEIHRLWVQLVKPHQTLDSVTTCLFAWVLPEGRTFVAQLGDGLVYYKTNHDVGPLLVSEKTFANETTGLGIARKLSDWRWQVFEEKCESIEITLMTDGICDDVLPENYCNFTSTLHRSLRTKSAKNAQKWLKRQLNNWPTALHGDDKTLAAIYLG